MNARLFTAAVAVVLVLVLDGTAFAYWGGSGSGTSSGTTGAAAPVGLSPATPAAGLRPGGTAAVALVVSNPNAYTVRVRSLALDTSRGTGGFTVDAGHSGCATSTLSFTTQTNGTTGWTVPAKVGSVNGTLSITLTGALAMSTSAANACQGASITVYLVVGS
jgi:hypothetical protein